MVHIRKSSGLIILLIAFMVAFGCQSRKKAMQASNAKAEAARVKSEQMERQLREQERAAQEAKDKEAKDKARREEEERERERTRQNQSKASTPAVKLSQYFNSIASSPNPASANASINEALTLFASPETPVLILISDSNGMKDYDRPTNIKDYLNYVKDQKKNINMISDVKTNGAGKIIELELKKN